MFFQISVYVPRRENPKIMLSGCKGVCGGKSVWVGIYGISRTMIPRRCILRNRAGFPIGDDTGALRTRSSLDVWKKVIVLRNCSKKGRVLSLLWKHLRMW